MKTLGFMYRRKNSSGLYGVVQAENELLKAIIQYSSWDRIVVWSEEKLDFATDKVIVRDIKTFINDLDVYSITCLHHVGLGASEFS